MKRRLRFISLKKSIREWFRQPWFRWIVSPAIGICHENKVATDEHGRTRTNTDYIFMVYGWGRERALMMNKSGSEAFFIGGITSQPAWLSWLWNCWAVYMASWFLQVSTKLCHSVSPRVERYFSLLSRNRSRLRCQSPPMESSEHCSLGWRFCISIPGR